MRRRRCPRRRVGRARGGGAGTQERRGTRSRATTRLGKRADGRTQSPIASSAVRRSAAKCHGQSNEACRSRPVSRPRVAVDQVALPIAFDPLWYAARQIVSVLGCVPCVEEAPCQI